MNTLIPIILAISFAAIIYVLLVGYDGLIKLIMSLFRVAGYADTLHYSPRKRQLSADSSMPISLLLPDCDKDPDIVQTVRELLKLDYPEYEIIAICNASESDALTKLTEAFSLAKVHQPIKRSVPMQQVSAVYRTSRHTNLIVLDKEGAARYDALNAGVNLAHYPIFAVLGKGYRLEEDALTQIAVSFSRSHHVAAVGGLPRIHKRGQLLGFFGSLHETEYLRAFPAGLSVPGRRRLAVIPSAFGAFRKQTVINEGGFIPSGSETEMVVRISREHIKRRQKFEVDLLPNPVFISAAPNNLPTLIRRSIDWQADTVLSLWKNKKMFLNPRYGRAGLFDTPYYWLFNIIGPIIELLGCFTVPLAFGFGIIGLDIFLAFLAVELLLGTVVSLSAVVAQEVIDNDIRDSARTVRRALCAIVNNFGYRQILLIFTTAGYFKAFSNKH